jgi:hypothetical protein
MATTAAAVRDAMLTLVEAITPAVHAQTRFERWREQVDFRTWAEQHPDACLRRVSIAYGNRSPAAVANTLVEENAWPFEVTIAYPTSHRFGTDGRNDLRDTITSDLRQIYRTIGPPGYASLTASATVLDDGDGFEIGDSVSFGVQRFNVQFYRSTAA